MYTAVYFALSSTMLMYGNIIIQAMIAVVLHELSHALVSSWLGDPTPKLTGRLSLNPIKHFDPIGFICLVLFRVGWAKPVMINPNYYRNPKRDTAFVAIAGPLMNALLAIINALCFVLSQKFLPTNLSIVPLFFYYGVLINVGLGLFNLIPIPPLDGSKILAVFLNEQTRREFLSFERYGFIIIILLINVLNSMNQMLFTIENTIVNALIQFFLLLFHLQ